MYFWKLQTQPSLLEVPEKRGGQSPNRSVPVPDSWQFNISSLCRRNVVDLPHGHEKEFRVLTFAMKLSKHAAMRSSSRQASLQNFDLVTNVHD
jgi:hypothetical protein